MRIGIGDTVRFNYDGETCEHALAKEWSMCNYCISVDSPIGQALLGKGVGDKFSVRVPSGMAEIEVLKISRSMANIKTNQ